MDNHQHSASLGEVEMAWFDLPATVEQTGIILLVHGFASSARVNWISTGWTKTLCDAGYRVIAVDNRGHGQSSKFYTPEDYGPDIFARDHFRLLDHLQISRCDMMGYSMGARIVCQMISDAPERCRKAIFGGMGRHITGGRGNYEVIAAGLEADDAAGISDPTAAAFRKFADYTKSDRRALAACIRPSRNRITLDMLKRIQTPVLVAVGSEDDVGGSATELAAVMPNASAFIIEGLDHMKATGAQSFKQAVVAFLDA